MSGYKRATVTISEQEYRRLHQADMKRRFGRFTKAKDEEPSAQQAMELANMLREMEDRQTSLERALGDVNQDVGHTESETMQAIQMQNARCYENLITEDQDNQKE